MAAPHYAARNASLLSRFDRHAKHPATAELRRAAETCLAISLNFANKRDDLVRDDLARGISRTADGRRAQLKEAQAGVEQRMRDARGPIDSAMKGVERLRGQIKPPQIDRTDAVGEMRRAELRAFVRSLPDHARMALMLTPTDPAVIDAVLDAPAMLSGVTAEHYETARLARDERLHGPALREIEPLQDVVDEANAAAGVAQNDLASLAQMAAA